MNTLSQVKFNEVFNFQDIRNLIFKLKKNKLSAEFNLFLKLSMNNIISKKYLIKQVIKELGDTTVVIRWAEFMYYNGHIVRRNIDKFMLESKTPCVETIGYINEIQLQFYHTSWLATWRNKKPINVIYNKI